MAEQPRQQTEEGNLTQRVERQFRRGNINFDFLNPVQPHEQPKPFTNDRRREARTGKRGIFNRGRPPKVISAWYSIFAFVALTGSIIALRLVWLSDHYIALFAIPFLLSMALASLIVFGLFLARPR